MFRGLDRVRLSIRPALVVILPMGVATWVVSVRAGDHPGSGGGGTTVLVAEAEVARRQAALVETRAMIEEGDLFFTQGELEEAVNLYREAYLRLRDTPAMAVIASAQPNPEEMP